MTRATALLAVLLFRTRLGCRLWRWVLKHGTTRWPR